MNGGLAAAGTAADRRRTAACRCSASPLEIRLATRRQSLRVEPPDGRADAHPLPARPRPRPRACSSRRARTGPRALRRAPRPLRAAAWRACRAVAVVGAYTLGKLQPTDGIRLNWRLIHFPPPVIDYVVAHEVAHLREMNHSPLLASGQSLRAAVTRQMAKRYRLRARDELKRSPPCGHGNNPCRC
jgi:hypothetical protein